MGEEFNLVKVAHRHRSCLSIRRALSSIIGGYPRPSVALISVGMPVSVEPDDSSSEIEPPTVEMPSGSSSPWSTEENRNGRIHLVNFTGLIVEAPTRVLREWAVAFMGCGY